MCVFFLIFVLSSRQRFVYFCFFRFFFQAEDGIRDLVRSRGLGDVYKRQLQHRSLPAPGSDAQLDELVAELHAPMLDRNHPGWQVYVIGGLERNRFAVFIKIHHSLVDGESGIALVHRSLSRSPRDRRIRTVIATSLPAAARAVPTDLLPRLQREGANAARTAPSPSLIPIRRCRPAD